MADENKNSIKINSPEVTICVFAYNHEDYIERAIESVVAQQTTFDFDVLVGEDLSTDRTPQICDRLAERFPNKVRIIHRTKEEKLFINNKPVGRGNLLNTILDSRGKFVALLDGDDFWTTPEKLQNQWDYFQSTPDVCLSFGNCYRLVEGQTLAISKNRQETAPFVFSDFPQAVCDGLPVGCVPSSYFFSRSVFDQGLEEMKKYFLECPFFDMLIPFSMSRFGKIAYHPDPLFCYLVRHGSVKGAGENRELFSVRCHEWIAKYLSSRNCDEKDIQKLSRRYSRKHSVASDINGFVKVIELLNDCEHLQYLPASTLDKFKTGIKQKLLSANTLSNFVVRSLPESILQSFFKLRKLAVH